MTKELRLSQERQTAAPVYVDKIQILEILNEISQRRISVKVKVGEGISFYNVFEAETYDEAGDFRQSDIEAALLSIIETDLAAQEQVVKDAIAAKKGLVGGDIKNALFIPK